MLTIRLQRTGKKHAPQYRLVVAQKHRSVSKLVHEILGHYNPISKVFVAKNAERIAYYVANNTEMSDSAKSLLARNGHYTPPAKTPEPKAAKPVAKKTTIKAK